MGVSYQEIEAEVRAVIVDGHAITSAGWMRATCPFCPDRVGRPDRDPRGAFGFNTRTGGYSCFRCGIRGQLREYSSHDFGDDLPEEEDDSELRQEPEGFYALGEEPGFSAISFKAARAYLMQRGVPVSMWKRFKIGACADGRYAGRIVVPVLGQGDVWTGFVARLWGKSNESPTYMYPGGTWRRSALFNHEALLVETDTPAIIVEGVFDALHVYPDGVALLGKCSAEQFEALAAARRPISVVLDGDAHEEGWALAQKLKLEGQRSGSVRLPPRRDPDEIMAAHLRELARQSVLEEHP
jgi:hypothetical protein